MYATERQGRIIVQLESAGRVSVADLSREFDVTTETIRRDLDALESAGRLRRVHGGAVRFASGIELRLDERELSNRTAKRAIARAALALVPTSTPASIVLDAGSTTSALADLLVGWRPDDDGVLDVVTHAVPLIGRLQDNAHLAVHVVGGLVRPTTSAAVGSETVQGFLRFRPDLAFIGANGLSAEFGLSTPDEREAAVKAAIVGSARRTVLLVDATKHHQDSFLRFAALDDIDTVVTDVAPDRELAAALEAADVDVIVA